MIELSGVIKSGMLGGFLIGIVFASVIRFVGKLEKYDKVLSYKQILLLSIATAFIVTIIFIILYYLGIYKYMF